MNKNRLNLILCNRVKKYKISNLNFKGFSTIFTDIINKKLPADIIYENENILAFKDIAPVAPVHYLIIPKKEIKSISSTTNDDKIILGEMLLAANIVADKLNIKKDGFRIVINDGKHGCQSVNHIHIHLIGGKQLGWPPGVNEKNNKI